MLVVSAVVGILLIYNNVRVRFVSRLVARVTVRGLFLYGVIIAYSSLG